MGTTGRARCFRPLGGKGRRVVNEHGDDRAQDVLEPLSGEERRRG